MPRKLPELPVPPALVYLLHQLKHHGIGYQMYGAIPGTEMSYVDLDRSVAAKIPIENIPRDWSIVCPHYIAHRALQAGKPDPIADPDVVPEAIVIAYGGKEAESFEHFQALCEQVRYLRQQTPSRLVYHNDKPPDPMEIHEIIRLINQESQ